MHRCKIMIRVASAIIVGGCFVQAAAVAAPASMPGLDDVSQSICSDTVRLARSQAGEENARRENARNAQQLNRGDEAEQRRAFLAVEVGKRALAAQQQISQETRNSLMNNKAQYRRLTGRDFDPSLCNGAQLRITEMARVQQQKEQELEAHREVRNKALADGEAYIQAQIACADWKMLQLPEESAERAQPGAQAEARVRFAAFSSDYRRKNGRPFDAASCR
jgi:hypothetical protein